MKGIARQFDAVHKGLIVVGAIDEPEFADALLPLAHKLDFPILADPLSGLRGYDDPYILTSYDAFLRDAEFVKGTTPELIIRFGAMPTAKPLLQYIERNPRCPLLVVNGQSAWNDPTQLASDFIFADPTAYCRGVLDAIIDLEIPLKKTNHGWLGVWQKAETATKDALRSGIDAFNEPFEGRVFTELAEVLPEGATLFVGNSMPIRDCDTFFWGKHGVSIIGNRGANGIDGIISSALGVSAARGGNTVLVIGDLSFYHDMNGLLAAKLHDLDLTIVLINNDGGGIFSFLPQAGYPEHFEQLFGTPTGLDFRPAVEMYSGRFTRPDSWADFRAALIRGMEEGGLHVVEVATDRARNVAMHRELWGQVHIALVARGVIPTEDAAS